MMKKILAVLLVLTMLFGFTGCVEAALGGVADYMESDEFQEDSEKWADEINSLLE